MIVPQQGGGHHDLDARIVAEPGLHQHRLGEQHRPAAVGDVGVRIAWERSRGSGRRGCAPARPASGPAAPPATRYGTSPSMRTTWVESMNRTSPASSRGVLLDGQVLRLPGDHLDARACRRARRRGHERIDHRHLHRPPLGGVLRGGQGGVVGGEPGPDLQIARRPVAAQHQVERQRVHAGEPRAVLPRLELVVGGERRVLRRRRRRSSPPASAIMAGRSKLIPAMRLGRCQRPAWRCELRDRPQGMVVVGRRSDDPAHAVEGVDQGAVGPAQEGEVGHGGRIVIRAGGGSRAAAGGKTGQRTGRPRRSSSGTVTKR